MRRWIRSGWPDWGIVGALLFLVTACSTGGSLTAIVIPCDAMDSAGSCPQDQGFAQLCSLADNSTCVNVCQGADALPGGCALDSDCAAPDTCDNDSLGGASTCECVSTCPDVGAAPGSVPAGATCNSNQDCSTGSCDNTDGLCVCVEGAIDGCSPVDPPGGPGSGAPNDPCDQGSDCQANSCRDPATNPSEGCTCRNLDGGPSRDCNDCNGTNTAPVNAPPNIVRNCAPSGENACNCDSDSGPVEVFVSPTGCF